MSPGSAESRSTLLGMSPVQYLRAGPKGAQPRVPVDLKSFESCFEEQHGVPER